MGTQSSISQDGKKPNATNIDSLFLNRETMSSYQGVRTETTDSNHKTISYEAESTISEKYTDRLQEQQEAKVPTLFEWKEGGNIVYITGSFCSWSQFFIMPKQTSGTFQLTLDLPRGFHQYKFKVDNEWRYSNLFPLYNDNNNLNNYLDTTNAVVSSKEKQKKALTVDEGVKLTKGRGDDYAIYYPRRNELNTDTPPVPPSYANAFDIHNKSYQTLLGDGFSNDILSRDCPYEKYSFRRIAKPDHVKLNHLHSKNSMGEEISMSNVVCSNCVTRVRNKFTTIVYYGVKLSC